MENKLKQLLRSKIFRFLAGFIIISLIVSAVLRTLTPSPPPPATLITNDKRLPTQINFESFSVSLPKNLTVYQAQNKNRNINDLAKEISSKLQMFPVQNIRNTWQTADEQTALSLEVDARYIVYQKFFEENEIDQVVNLVTKDEAKQIALDFIQGKNILNNIVVSSASYYQISHEGWQPVTSEAEANAIEVSISQKIDSIPVVLGDRYLPSAQAFILLNGEIVKIYFYPNILELQKVETYQTLPLDKIKNLARSGRLTFIKQNNQVAPKDNSTPTHSVTFTSGTLEYRQNEQNGYILPYIRFSGTQEHQDGSRHEVEAISPAIEIGN